MTDKSDSKQTQTGEKEECPCEVPAMPSIECVERVKKIPLVEAAWNQSTQIYSNVKGYNSVLTWTLDTAESTVNKVVEQTIPVVAPIVKKLETPIGMVDKTLCKGLDVVENAVPCINQEPAQIRDTTKKHYDSARQQVKSLQELSLNTANELMNSPVANVVAGSVNNLMQTADKILDYILPPGAPLDVPRAEKVIQALVTIGGLTNRAARHAYDSLSSVLRTAGKQDIRETIRNLLTLIQLQNLLSPAPQAPSSTGAPAKDSPHTKPAPTPAPAATASAK